MTELPRNQILTGDALERLRTLPDGSIDSIVTSPPYFRLRNYGHGGQIGLEPHVDDWVRRLRAVMAECARVLVPTGTVWLNLGDSYALRASDGAARKSLLLGPERLAMALLADGWTIRNKIVWNKPNTVPSSVRDRLSTTHEVIYLLTRSPSYYFDLDSIRIPHTTRPRPRRTPRDRPPTKSLDRPTWLGPNSDADMGLAALRAAGLPGHPLGKNPGDVWTLSVSRYRGAHFATFPEHLATRLVTAGAPRMRCPDCRAPWTRSLRRSGTTAHREPPRPTCGHERRPEPGVVLDPFIGAGTTAIAASKLGRDWLGIELNPSFVAMANERITGSLGGSTNSNPQPRKEVT